jgi:hypothetical protein
MPRAKRVLIGDGTAQYWDPILEFSRVGVVPPRTVHGRR